MGKLYLPEGGLAAARTEVRDLSMVVMPALAMEIVCCSIACIAVRLRLKHTRQNFHDMSMSQAHPIASWYSTTLLRSIATPISASHDKCC